MNTATGNVDVYGKARVMRCASARGERVWNAAAISHVVLALSCPELSLGQTSVMRCLRERLAIASSVRSNV